MFVGQRDGCRLIPWGGGAGGSEEKYQTTPSIGFILSGSGRHAQVHVLGGDFKLDDVVLWIRVCCGTLWHLPRCYSCLFWECSWVHYGPLWPISRDGNLQALRECPSPAWQGVIPAEPTGVRMRCRTPWQGLPLSFPPQHQLYLQGWAHPCSWAGTLHISSFPMSEHQHSVWIHCSPQAWDG